MSPRKGFFGRLSETDEERLAAEVRDWTSAVPNTLRIADAPLREQVRVCGQVRRITVWPKEGTDTEYLEALLSDGTGEVNAEWLGRRSIPGLKLGTRMVLEGVLRQERSRRVPTMSNPKFEFVG